MAGTTQHAPEPLQVFRGLVEALALALHNVEAAHARYREEREAGRILANSVDALRVELTYHSNAIEGKTLSLRDTQLVIEGYAPPGGKTLREIYNLVAIYPFSDGNGRVARLVMNYHLLRHGYPHTIIDVGERALYLAALEEANAGRCERFATFVLHGVERSIRRLIGDADQ